MCALCGALGIETHWSDAVARPDVYTRNDAPHARRLERARRIRLLNAVLHVHRLTLSDWQSRAYLLSTATGKTAIVDTLAHLWPEAEALCGRRFDPLDEAFLARLSPE